MLFLDRNICCGYSLESPRRGDSNEYPQHMFLWRTIKSCSLIIIRYPPYLFYCRQTQRLTSKVEVKSNNALYGPFCRTCISMGDLGVQVSVRLSVCQQLPWIPCEHNSSYSFVPIFLFWNFAGVFFTVWGCACGLNIIVKLFFVTFSTLNLVIFLPQCTVYSKTVGLPDKTGKFWKCPTIFFSLSVHLSDKFLIVS